MRSCGCSAGGVDRLLADDAGQEPAAPVGGGVDADAVVVEVELVAGHAGAPLVAWIASNGSPVDDWQGSPARAPQEWHGASSGSGRAGFNSSRASCRSRIVASCSRIASAERWTWVAALRRRS